MSICSTHGSLHQKMEHTDTSWVDFSMTKKIQPFSGAQSGHAIFSLDSIHELCRTPSKWTCKSKLLPKQCSSFFKLRGSFPLSNGCYVRCEVQPRPKLMRKRGTKTLRDILRSKYEDGEAWGIQWCTSWNQVKHGEMWSHKRTEIQLGMPFEIIGRETYLNFSTGKKKQQNTQQHKGRWLRWWFTHLTLEALGMDWSTLGVSKHQRTEWTPNGTGAVYIWKICRQNGNPSPGRGEHSKNIWNHNLVLQVFLYNFTILPSFPSHFSLVNS